MCCRARTWWCLAGRPRRTTGSLACGRRRPGRSSSEPSCLTHGSRARRTPGRRSACDRLAPRCGSRRTGSATGPCPSTTMAPAEAASPCRGDVPTRSCGWYWAMARPELDEIVVAGRSEAWEAFGFTVVDGVVALGGVRIRLAGESGPEGVAGWSLRGIDAHADLDGLPTSAS